MMVYSQNNWAFFEDAIHSKTIEKEDEVFNSIIPYIYDYYPLITFTPEETFIEIPQFYEDEALFVPDIKYEHEIQSHDHIFKCWVPQESPFEIPNDNEIRVVPKDSVHEINPRRIDKIEVHLVSYSDNDVNSDDDSLVTNYRDRQIDTLDENDYSFSSGKIILNKDVYLRLQSEWVDRKNRFSKDHDIPEDYDWHEVSDPNAIHDGFQRVFIIFEIKLDKYKPIDDDKENSRIALMQSVHAGVLQYFYESQLATNAQSKLNELAYTIAITVLTTICTGGIGTTSMIKEPLEEIFLDPTIEAVMSGLVRGMGGNAYAQLIASCIAETGRESIGGDIARLRSQKGEVNVKADTDLETANTIQSQKQRSRLTMALSTIAMFAASLTGIGAPVALTLGTMGLTFQLSMFQNVRSAYKEAKIQALLEAFDIAITQDPSVFSTGIANLLQSYESHDSELAALDLYLERVAKYQQFKLMTEQKIMPSIGFVLDFAKINPDVLRYSGDYITAMAQYGNIEGLDTSYMTFWGGDLGYWENQYNLQEKLQYHVENQINGKGPAPWGTLATIAREFDVHSSTIIYQAKKYCIAYTRDTEEGLRLYAAIFGRKGKTWSSTDIQEIYDKTNMNFPTIHFFKDSSTESLITKEMLERVNEEHFGGRLKIIEYERGNVRKGEPAADEFSILTYPMIVVGYRSQTDVPSNPEVYEGFKLTWDKVEADDDVRFVKRLERLFTEECFEPQTIAQDYERGMPRATELLQTGIYEELYIPIESEMTVGELLQEKNIEGSLVGVIVDGREEGTSFIIKPGDEVIVIPRIKGAAINYLEAFNKFVSNLKIKLRSLGFGSYDDVQLSDDFFKEVCKNGLYFISKRDQIKSRRRNVEKIGVDQFYKFLAVAKINIMKRLTTSYIDYHETFNDVKDIFDIYHTDVALEQSVPELYKLYRDFVTSLKVLLVKAGIMTSMSDAEFSRVIGTTSMGRNKIYSLKTGKTKAINKNNLNDIKNKILSKYHKKLSDSNLLLVFEVLFTESYERMFLDDQIFSDELIRYSRFRYYNIILNLFPKGSINTINQLSWIIYRDPYKITNECSGPNRVKKLSRRNTNLIINNLAHIRFKEFFEKTGYKITSREVKAIVQKVKYYSSEYIKTFKTVRGSVHEDIARFYMEHIFGKSFKPVFPVFLSGLELDGYNEELKIAFEYDGPQHHDWRFMVRVYKLSEEEAKKRLANQQKNDRLKDELCKRNGITLIRISYEIDSSQFQQYIMDNMDWDKYKELTGNDIPVRAKISREEVLGFLLTNVLKSDKDK